MIRALRLWLLGADPEGPALRDDPLYRWEVRRHWTPRRYAAWVVLALACWALAAVFVLGTRWRGPGEIVGAGLLIAFLGRFPLEFLAVLGGALAIVPERSSGEFEQLVLTPLDPWRFCLARYVARMKGVAVLWLLAGLILLTVWLPVVLAASAGSYGRVSIDGHWPWTVIAPSILAAMYVDWGLVLLIDGASGLRFSAAANSAASAVSRAMLRSFLTLPLVLAMAAISGQLIGMMLGILLGLEEPYWLWVAGAAFFRLWLGLVILRDDLARARRGTERLFLEPED